MRIKTQA
ncbi:zinc finger protein, partial [Trichinella spiralis]